MSRKRKHPDKWQPQWFEVCLYEPVGWLKRKRFYLIATTHNVAARKIQKQWPKAKILSISPLGY